MASVHDGPASPLFTPLVLKGNVTQQGLRRSKALSDAMRESVDHAPSGACTSWGIPFDVGKVLVAAGEACTVPLAGVRAPWLVFMHTTDIAPQQPTQDGFFSPTRGEMQLGVHVADYVFCYGDDTEERVPVRWRYQIGMYRRGWGEHCFEAMGHRKPHPLRLMSDEPGRGEGTWGWTQTRVGQPDLLPWVYWIWPWENPHPRKALSALRVEPRRGTLVIAGLSAGKVHSQPLRWEARQKAVLTLPRGQHLDPKLDEAGLSNHVKLDLGQVISVQPQTVYPNGAWANTPNAQLPEMAGNALLVEYAAHPEARFHLESGRPAPVAKLGAGKKAGRLTPVAQASQRVRIRVVDKETKQPVPVRLHIHGEAGEYLPPVDRHRIPNPHWFEDYSADYVADGKHFCTYIPGETSVKLPLGSIFIEVSKGLEIKPIRKTFQITPRTHTLTLTLEKVLPWRERGWVTADTHVHFLSPRTAQLEGAAEGVNVVNLLASQWGELMTNVGDFDGKTTFGSKEAGGDGEYLVRVGTENRQHVLGHISLLGYDGDIIAPMTTGGPDESALGDPVEILLTEWARQCREQGGLAIFPHFPEPRAENAAALVEGAVDAVEMASSDYRYGGISPYSLSDWYRYLNCGYFVPAVGGTDKMSAGMLLGAIRTYARLPKDAAFDYEIWKDAIRSGHTFVTFGPLMELNVEGKHPGQEIHMSHHGGTVNVSYELASVTIPMTRVDLVVNGEIVESRTLRPYADQGHWSVPVKRSSWVALLVRGQYAGEPEWIAAHSSPVIVRVDGSEFYAAADAVTILEQIEGAIAYFDTLATRDDTQAYRRMRLTLTSAYRTLHNRMHAMGHDHPHTVGTDHPEHH